MTATLCRVPTRRLHGWQPRHVRIVVDEDDNPGIYDPRYADGIPSVWVPWWPRELRQALYALTGRGARHDAR